MAVAAETSATGFSKKIVPAIAVLVTAAALAIVRAVEAAATASVPTAAVAAAALAIVRAADSAAVIAAASAAVAVAAVVAGECPRRSSAKARAS